MSSYPDYLEQLRGAVRAVAVHSPTSYSWFGRQSPRLYRASRRALTPNSARNYLIYALQLQLYSDFYCRGAAAPSTNEATSLAMMGLTPFVEQLSQANSGEGYWEEGWEVVAFDDDGLPVVRKNGLSVRARGEDCKPDSEGLEIAKTLLVRSPKELLSISPSFYMALGNYNLTPDAEQEMVRLYWNVNAEGALKLMRSGTKALNEAQIPFRLKALNDPEYFSRCDSAVLYISKYSYGDVRSILERIYPQLYPHLRQSVPAFTCRLAPGLGLAEDPGGGESFGLHRCKLLADSLLLAHERGVKPAEERVQVVLERFAAEGISLERPYLRPGSADDYAFHNAAMSQPRPARATSVTPDKRVSQEDYLQTSLEIGNSLIRDAVWYQGQCNWMGASLSEGGRRGITYKALGPSMYDGTAGVALFLAELYGATGDAEARRAALGAIRQSLSHFDAIQAESRLGLYMGWVGIAWVTARIGGLLGDDELLNKAADLLAHCALEQHPRHEFDLLSGSAGAIAGVLTLHRSLGDPSLLDFAVRLGDDLLASAQRSDAGYSWKSVVNPTARNLTGLSHGAAGAGYALLELSNATGDDRYRMSAERAFEYERHWFNPDEGNWPDFRYERGSASKRSKSRSYHTFWCHGASGIALSRLRAYSVRKDDVLKAEAIVGLETTRKAVETALLSGTGNYSLCHGEAGKAEVLLYGRQVLGQEWTDLAELAARVAAAGIGRYGKQGDAWPCGAGGGYSPTLMLGLAGIGMFYLRLHDPSIPSVLLLQSEAQVESSTFKVRSSKAVSYQMLQS